MAHLCNFYYRWNIKIIIWKTSNIYLIIIDINTESALLWVIGEDIMQEHEQAREPDLIAASLYHQ